MKNVIIFTIFSTFYACARIPLETRLSAKNAALLGVPTKRGSRTNQAWFTHQPRQYFFEPNLVQGGLFSEEFISIYFIINNTCKFFLNIKYQIIMGIKVKIIEKSKPGHPEEKYYCAVPNENGMTKYFVMKVSNQTQIYKRTIVLDIFLFYPH